MPAKFGLTYRDKDNSNKTPLCIHRAPLGTHERFIGFLIEHYAGNFPLWLAPDQVRVITLNDDEALIAYAKPIVTELRANMVRVEADYSSTPFKAKIANAEQMRVHTMLVIGGRDLEAGPVTVRLHHGGPQGAKPKAEVVADVWRASKTAGWTFIRLFRSTKLCPTWDKVLWSKGVDRGGGHFGVVAKVWICRPASRRTPVRRCQAR